MIITSHRAARFESNQTRQPGPHPRRPKRTPTEPVGAQCGMRFLEAGEAGAVWDATPTNGRSMEPSETVASLLDLR